MSLQDVVQKLLNQVYPELIDPNSPYYLPTFIKANKYDPYGPFEWNKIPMSGQGIVTASQQICNDSHPPTESWIPSTKTTPNIQLDLSDSYINGLAQLQMPNAPTAGGADGTTVTARMQYLSPITLTGNFTLTQWCCPTTDGVTCSGPDTPPSVGNGTYIATIESAAVVVVFSITTIEEGVLDLGNFSVVFAASPTPPNMTITAKITSIQPPSDQPGYEKIAEQALNDPTFLTNVVNQINNTMNSTDALGTLQSILTQEIDNYLKANHLYPFDQSSVALF